MSIASFVGWSFLRLLGGMAGAALVMAVVLSPWMVRQWWAGRQLRSLDDPLPGHVPGLIRRSAGDRRQLHRDLLLLLVVNADREDEAAD